MDFSVSCLCRPGLPLRGSNLAGMTGFLSYDPNGEPQFGLIKAILVLDQTKHTPVIKLVVEKWETKGFDRHFFHTV